MTSSKVAVVLGVGQGIGGALARSFAAKGYRVAIMARNQTYKKNPDKLTPLVSQIKKETAGAVVLPIVCDAAQRDSVNAAFARVRAELGGVDVLCYNAGARKFESESVLDVDPALVEQYWRVNCLGALHCIQAVGKDMVDRGSGTILLTGATASLRGSSGMASFAVGKFGLRALAQSTARELGPKGVHVAHVIVDGAVDLPILRKLAPDMPKLLPDDVANTMMHLVEQPKSCWTFELDLRPSDEPMAKL